MGLRVHSELEPVPRLSLVEQGTGTSGRFLTPFGSAQTLPDLGGVTDGPGLTPALALVHPTCLRGSNAGALSWN